ncbi:hypothetical protein L7F22_001926 [Adiantum nelumboides]|nr:hypothetical protein [Adiantum nelumboides]
MSLLGLHEDYHWAMIKDKALTDVEDAMAKAKTFPLINGANYEKKRNIDHRSGEHFKEAPSIPNKPKLLSSSSPDTLSRGAREKKTTRNAVIAVVVRKEPVLAVARQASKSNNAPRRSPRSRRDDPQFKSRNLR